MLSVFQRSITSLIGRLHSEIDLSDMVVCSSARTWSRSMAWRSCTQKSGYGSNMCLPLKMKRYFPLMVIEKAISSSSSSSSDEP